ncbi:uncharacterized protein [Procambarus clarkii]|uniref:uncharacterized protein n=1 Tax=Procambarus clarkii TaxID=6728 RepID=UPI001E674E58|nr:uncharacterized protein LOC123766852 [Procambarus clarkii]
MNTFVCIDKTEEPNQFGYEEESEEDPLDIGNPPPSASSPSIEELIKKENEELDEASLDGNTPIIVDDVPVYLSQLEDGSSIYIRQYPPTVEEMFSSRRESSPSFDGFSVASGSTFEGFSECSWSSSDSFEGFPDVKLEDFSVVGKDTGLTFGSAASTISGRGSKFSKQVGINYNDKDRASITPKRRNSCKIMGSKRQLNQSESKKGKSVNRVSPRKMTRSGTRAVEEEAKRPFIEPVTPIDKHDAIGELCSEVGCSISFLESMKVTNIPINNGMVYELDEFAKSISWKRVDVVKWIQRLSGVNDVEPTIEDLDKIHMVLKRRNALKVTLSGKKIAKVKLRAFDLMEFVLPSLLEKEDGNELVSVKEEDINSDDDLLYDSPYSSSEELKKSSLLKKRKLAELQKNESYKDLKVKKGHTRGKEPTSRERIMSEVMSNVKKEHERMVYDAVNNSKKEASKVNQKNAKKKNEFSDNQNNRKRYTSAKERMNEMLVDGSHKNFPKGINRNFEMTSSDDACIMVKKESECHCNVAVHTSQNEETEIDVKEEKLFETSTINSEVSTVPIEAKSIPGTIGFSKSGRLRKLSAKGIQSIEIKSLFMPSSAPSIRPLNVTDKRKMTKKITFGGLSFTDDSSKAISQYTRGSDVTTCNRYKGFLEIDNSVVSFTFKNGHLVPKFKEVNYYLGDYCCEAGVTVEDINSEGQKDIEMTVGMVKELHDFYVSRGATKTSLALKLFQMAGVPILDYTHVLTAVLTINKAAKTNLEDFSRLQSEFRLPKRQVSYQDGLFQSQGHHCPKKRKIAVNSILKINEKNKKRLLHRQGKINKLKNVTYKRLKGINARPKKILSRKPRENSSAIGNELLKTRGKEGSITRGDIVFLYTQWLKNKLAVGSNVFVTDLLKDVQKLMAERKVQSIRIPAGTLMSSSVRLHDEYTQMLTVSKEDAIMYLEEDWLEDIQYLVSLSGPSRRSTIEGDITEHITKKIDASNSTQPENTNISDSEGSVKSLVIDDSVISDDSSTDEKPEIETKKDSECEQSKYDSTEKSSTETSQTCENGNGTLGKVEGQTSCVMESVGKRSSAIKRSIRLSLEEYDFEDVEEQLEVKSEKQTSSQRTELSKNMISDAHEQKIENFEVEKIIEYQEVDNKDSGNKFRYLVRWLGFGPEEDSWVDEKDLQCPEMLEKYWKTVRRKNQGRLSRKIKSSSASPRALDRSKSFEAAEGNESRVGGPDKENEGNIIEAMIQHTTQENCSNPKLSEQSEGSVTRRELLDVYDTWRQENQSVLMAGGSNTVNLETLVSRAKDLMKSKQIKHFHPESLLNACFMMTMMRTTLKTEKTLNRFLDSNCTEVLEASHKQYLITEQKHSRPNREVPGKKHYANKKITLSVLQNDLKKMHEEFLAAVELRSSNCKVLRVLEEEFYCLETILKDSEADNSNVAVLLQEKLETLKEDLRSLENMNGEGSNMAVCNIRKNTSEKVTENFKCPITFTEPNSDQLCENVLQAGLELIKCGIPSHKVDGLIELVINKIGGRRLMVRSAGARSIAEEISLVNK